MIRRAARVPFSRVAGLLIAIAWAVSWRRNRYRGLHDSLTGLPNRTRLTQDLASLPVGGDHGHPTLLCARVDDLAAINHAYGRAGRNRVLQEVAGRISTALGPTATLARSGDDEFAAIVAGPANAQPAATLARQVQRALVDPIDLGGAKVTVPVSIGIATAQSAEDRTSLLRNGDLALEAARRSGRGACATYEPSMLDDVQARWRLEVELAEAFDRRQLTVWYQPIVDIRSGHMVGVEALVRWQHPERGVVGPDDFLPTVAETGRLPELTRFVLGEACAWARSWQAKFPDEPPISVAVNVSPRDLVTSDVIDDVTRALSDSGLSPASLTLEVTETSVFEFINAIAPILNTLQAMGVAVALDDFGTGFSSLSHLRRLPVDVVKIDRTFTDGLATEVEDSLVVTAVMHLAHTLELAVVAEGVEHPKHLVALRELGCEFAQGNLVAKPAPPDEVPSPGEIRERMAGLGDTVVDLRVAANEILEAIPTARATGRLDADAREV